MRERRAQHCAPLGVNRAIYEEPCEKTDASPASVRIWLPCFSAVGRHGWYTMRLQSHAAQLGREAEATFYPCLFAGSLFQRRTPCADRLGKLSHICAYVRFMRSPVDPPISLPK
jgi:hypothetical protein